MNKRQKLIGGAVVVGMLFFVLLMYNNREGFEASNENIGMNTQPANVNRVNNNNNNNNNNVPSGMHRMPDGSLMDGDTHPSNNNVNNNVNRVNNNVKNNVNRVNNNVNNNVNRVNNNNRNNSTNSRNVNIGGDLAPVSNGNNNLTGSPGNVVGVSSSVGSPLDIAVSTDPNQMQVNSLNTSLAELQSTSNNAVQMAPVNTNNNNIYALENNLNVNVIANNLDNINSMNSANIGVPTNNNGASATGIIDQAAPVNGNNNGNNGGNNGNNNRNNGGNNVVNNGGNNGGNNVVNNGGNNTRNNTRNNGGNNNRINTRNNGGNNNRINTRNNGNNNGKNYRVTLVHAKWCGYCKKAKPEWDKLVSNNNFNNVELRDIEDTNKEEMAKYKGKVKGFPTFVVEDISDPSNPVYISQFNAIEKSKMEQEINNATN